MSTRAFDRFAPAQTVADAVLYEGYVLYPYRASSRKNQVRWQFGVLTPRAFSEDDGSERWQMRTECLVDPHAVPMLAVRVRCLQLQHRAVEAVVETDPGETALAGTGPADECRAFTAVTTLDIDGTVYVDWDEALERTVDLPPVRLVLDEEAECEHTFVFEGTEHAELIRSDGDVVGRIVRRSETVAGCVRLSSRNADGGVVDGGAAPLLTITVAVENSTQWLPTSVRRDDAMARSLVAVHTMLAVDGGTFVSLLDPPDDAREAVAGCRNDGAFPVLLGSDDIMLSSPIILYDHPEVAPESPGDLYDATEIDEILALRVLTLTDEEKSEARGTDPRAAAIIDRCDDMPPEVWERLHGAVRSLGPAVEATIEPDEGLCEAVPWWDPAADESVDPWSDSVMIAGVEVSKGSAVRLWPSRRSDAQDLFLHGLAATVAGVFRDVDGTEQVAVTIDDDPATAELQWQGRYLFFHPDEVEPLPGQQVAS